MKILEAKRLQEAWPPIARYTVEFEDGRTREWTALDLPDGAAVLAVTDARQFVLLRQHVLALEEPGLQLPGGAAEEGESIEETARRELLEETGYRVTSLQYAFPYVNLPSYARGIVHLFLGLGASLADDTVRPIEIADVVLLDIAEAVRMAERGEIPTASTALAILALYKKLTVTRVEQ